MKCYAYSRERYDSPVVTVHEYQSKGRRAMCLHEANCLYTRIPWHPKTRKIHPYHKMVKAARKVGVFPVELIWQDGEFCPLSEMNQSDAEK